MSGYRLIWFQHMHKVAGTTIVELALANGETLYPNHINGNPYDDDGNLIELWKYDREKLKTFIDHCQKKGITFVATEWGAPEFEVLANDSRIILISCLRDPYKRFLSNYKYDIFKGFSEITDAENYANSSSVSIYNYYTVVFSRKNYEDVKKNGLTKKDFSKAVENLNLFDKIIILEEKDSIEHLKKYLGWNNNIENKNNNHVQSSILVKLISWITGWKDDPGKKKKTINNPFLAAEILKKMKFRLFFRYLSPEKIEPPASFKRNFLKNNFHDLEIYEKVRDH